MPVKAMLNKKENEKRIGKLKKTDKIKKLKKVEDALFEILDKYRIDITYDVIAHEVPYFKTLGYTEWAGNLIVYPLCNKMREEQIYEAYLDGIKQETSLSEWLKSEIINGNANKYKDRKRREGIEYRDNLIVLLGSNKLKKSICLNKLKWIVENNDKETIWIKPHPITHYSIIGEIKDMFGADIVLDRDEDLYDYLVNAKTVFTTHHSETAVFSIVLDKEIEPMDVFQERTFGAFSHINRYLFEVDSPKEFLDITFQSYKCGIFNPEIEENWKEKLEKYIDYIMSKRTKFKDKYIATETKDAS